MITNSKRLKGVVTAVFGMCSSNIDTWWYALIKSNVLKMCFPCVRDRVRVVVSNKGVVTAFKPRKSSHGLHTPSCFCGARCSSAAHRLQDGQIPSRTMYANSDFAIFSFSGGRRRDRLATSGPFVSM